MAIGDVIKLRIDSDENAWATFMLLFPESANAANVMKGMMIFGRFAMKLVSLTLFGDLVDLMAYSSRCSLQRVFCNPLKDRLRLPVSLGQHEKASLTILAF